jgi:hypothetical protein
MIHANDYSHQTSRRHVQEDRNVMCTRVDISCSPLGCYSQFPLTTGIAWPLDSLLCKRAREVAYGYGAINLSSHVEAVFGALWRVYGEVKTAYEQLHIAEGFRIFRRNRSRSVVRELI